MGNYRISLYKLSLSQPFILCGFFLCMQSEEFNMKAEELKCQELFKDIQTRGPHAFKILLECFKNTGHLRHYDILRRPSHMGNPESQQLSVRKSTSFPHSTTSVSNSKIRC